MESCFNLANAALIRYLNFLLVFQRKMKQECLGGTEATISMIFGYFYNMTSMDGLGGKKANKIANYNDVYKTCITDLSGIPPSLITANFPLLKVFVMCLNYLMTTECI